MSDPVTFKGAAFTPLQREPAGMVGKTRACVLARLKRAEARARVPAGAVSIG